MNLIHNERMKIVAAALNTLATATITAGVLVPTAAIFYGLGTPSPSRPLWQFVLSGLVCVVIGGAHHSGAHAFLGRLRE